MDTLWVLRALIWGSIAVGLVIVITLSILRRHEEALRIEYWLAMAWVWLRLGLCVTLAVVLFVVLVLMLVSGKAPNGASVHPSELLVAGPVGIVAIIYLIWVGLFGKVRKLSSIAEDRDDQHARFRRHRIPDRD